MDIFVLFYSLLFYAIGRWVKHSPSVMAGYYSIPKERRERVARRTTDYLYKAFCWITVLMVVAYVAMRLTGMDKILSGCLSTVVISTIGTVWAAVSVQRYNKPLE